jgi:hypothetical protein
VGSVIRREELEQAGACNGAVVPVWPTVLGAFRWHLGGSLLGPAALGMAAAWSLLLSGMHCAMMYSCSQRTGPRSNATWVAHFVMPLVLSVDISHDKAALEP